MPWNNQGGGGDDGGPWGNPGSGGGRGSGGGNGGSPWGQGGGGSPQDIDKVVRQGREALGKMLPSGGKSLSLLLIVAIAIWALTGFYRVNPQQQGVVLRFGEWVRTTAPGLHYHIPYPIEAVMTPEVTRDNRIEIGFRDVSGNSSSRRDIADESQMITGDENIVDIDFQVVWNVNDPARFLFNLREPQATIRAVSESAMREIIAQSDLAPILNRDRAAISDSLELLIQTTLDSYDSGVNVVRVNFDKADPPEQVIDSFREVQAAEQQRDRLEKEADAYANRILAQARGEAAQVREQAEAYRAQVVNEATGEASRFSAVLTEYRKAPEVTRKRLYLETMEQVLGDVEKVIIDESAGGSGVVPYLPLNQLRQETK